MRALLASIFVISLVSVAYAAPEEDFGGGSVIFARGGSLIRTDPRGKTETEIAKLPANAVVRALRTDESGKVLLANIGGKWAWMPLDGKATTLTDLPCADGPAQVAPDGACVLCRAAAATSSLIVNLGNGKSVTVPVPTAGARLTGGTNGQPRSLVWADATGIWSAPANAYTKKTKVAPEAPLRGFLASPDGAHALGVYMDVVHDSVHTTKPGEMLFTVALDGDGPRRKAIRNGVGAEWSHDSKWSLVQDKNSACIMKLNGGEYKCWRGFTGASIAPDGQWALLVGSQNRAAPPPPPKKKGKTSAKGKKAPPGAEPSGEAENSGEGDEEVDDVEVAPPSGPLALYRAQLSGAYTTSPALIVKAIDGAAVWVPGTTSTR
ncbi:MAG TPA: hypothetical protein VGM39_08260 [Kofleriaceae bacterium]|jgi:hypothetical protein